MLPGLRVEKVRGASMNIKSCRVARGIRIVFETAPGSVLQLLYVGAHDNSYRIAESRLIDLMDDGSTYGGRLGEIMADSDLVLGDHCVGAIDWFVSACGFDTEQQSAVIREALQSVIEDGLANGTTGKAVPYVPANNLISLNVNIIPSVGTGECRSLLVAFCFDDDSFDERVREIVYHAGILCPDTKGIVLVTSQWNPKTWKNKHEAAFSRLSAEVLVLFAGLGWVSPISG
jgi:hypothetical protein